MPRRFCCAAIAIVACLCALAAGALEAAEDAAGHQWFSASIEVKGLPPGASFVPVSCEIDFTGLLEALGVRAAIDEHTLRLYHLSASGKELEEPVQYDAADQPRAKKPQKISGAANTSYIAEFRAGGPADELRQKGVLTWIARADNSPTSRYRLEFGVPRRGLLIQVPFPPQNLRAFDDQNRATVPRYFPRMQVRPQYPLDGMVHVLENRDPVTTYHTGPTLAQAAESTIRRPFLFPVYGPDGVSLTDFGKPHDPTGSHAHHYSLWVAHHSVAGQDFWSERGGAIIHERFDPLIDGPVFCRLVQLTRWRLKNTEYLRERRAVTIYRAGDGRLMDFELEFLPAGSQPIVLGKTTFGFLSVRVAQSMTPFDGGGEILNSHGDRNEQAVHLKTADWLDQSGPVVAAAADRQDPAGTGWGGIAMLDHPSNPNHPIVWHCRNDGWASASFNGESAYTLRSGEPLRLRYRLYLHRGNAVASGVAERYAEYASQPIVQLGRPEIRPRKLTP